MRQTAKLGDRLDMRECRLAVEHLDGIVGIPVAGNHHASAVEFYSSTGDAFLVETAKTVELMGHGIVQLHLVTLADAEIVLETACQQHLPGLHHDRDATVVVIDSLQLMPFAVFQVLCRRGQYKTRGMTAEHRHFAIHQNGRVAAAGNVHVGQPFCLNPDDRTIQLINAIGCRL